MPNMNYCQFENTKKDLYDCLDAIDDCEVANEEEAYHGERMFRNVLDLMKEYEVIENFDDEALKRLMKGAVRA